MTLDKSPQTIKQMFNTIAKHYDFMNNIISFGTHNFIKYLSIKNLGIHPHDSILDMCCGTGDLSLAAKNIQPLACITGIDFSDNMLKFASSKSKDIKFIQGDVINLPFEDNSFDFVTIGFGLRNVSQPEKAVEEAYRVLRPGGKFLHLDFGRKNIISRIFDIIVLAAVKLLSVDKKSYEYLINSKKIFPLPQEMIEDFERKGFRLIQRKDYMFGVISCQILKK